MNIVSIQLQRFLCETISPENLMDKDISITAFKQWKSYLKTEFQDLRLVIRAMHFADERKNEAAIIEMIAEFVQLSNLCNKYIFKGCPILKNHPEKTRIKVHYNFSVNLIDEVIALLAEKFPHSSAKIQVPDNSCGFLIAELKNHLAGLRRHLIRQPCHDKLKAVAIQGVSQLIQKKHLTANDYDYIIKLTGHLMSVNELTTETTFEQLITDDFNVPEFFLYYVNHINKELHRISGLHEQREFIILEKDRVSSLNFKNGLRFPGGGSNLYMEINNFLIEKYQLVKQLVKMRRQVIRDNEQSKSAARFLINLPVTQFGLFIRMQVEKGLLAKEHLGDLFTFFATHFYTPNTLFISADSLQKKSTDVDFSTAKKLKGHLIEMLNWLNTNYNLSNYNGS
jgi:hypothetical protein